MGSFEDWCAADERWLNDNIELLGFVYQWFLNHEDWPDVGPLQHSMYQRSPRITNVQEVANARPAFPGQFAPAIAQGIRLGARHLLKIPEAQYLLNSTVRAAQAAVEIFLATTPGEQAQVHQSSLGPASPGGDSIRRLLPKFVFSDHPTLFAGGSLGNEWTMGINESLVMRFEGVVNPNDFVARQLAIIKEWSNEHDARLRAVRKGGPFRAFIVMPFEEEWSDASRAFIDYAISLLDSAILADRADDMDAPGRITDQIVNRFEEADLVISDITGNNANVGWELGFAYAQSKPCVIIRRMETASAPFDIYDQRRVDYSSNPTEAEAQRLKRMIEAAIEQVRNAAVPMSFDPLFKGA